MHKNSIIESLKLDIILPVFNPPNAWDLEVIRQYKVLKSRLEDNVITRLILVDDGNIRDLSKGKQNITEQIEESKWISYPKNKGKGYALRQGVSVSGGDVIMYTDHDFPYTYGSMESMIQKLLDSKLDAVIGVRDESYYEHISGRRRWISLKLKDINRQFLKLPTDDTQCGLKVFTKNMKDIFLSTKTNRYLIDVEFLKKLSNGNFKMGLQQVKLRDNITLSKISNLKLVKEFISYLRIALFA